MIQATLKEVAAWCGAAGISAQDADAAGALRIAGVSTDSRSIAPGRLFVPLAGDRFDGHDYLATAERAGAAAALWQQDRPAPKTALPLLRVADTLAALQALAAGYLAAWKPRVVGVTGSNGKTTTKDLIASVLATTYKVAKTEGNFNNHIGLPLTILGADPGTEALVLEMGMSGRGEISLLSRLTGPDAAVITNVGESHLLQLGSRRNIARAKLEIAEGLKPGGTLVYYGDEPLLREELAALARPAADLRTVTFGEREGDDLRAERIAVRPDGVSFALAGEPAGAAYALPIPGRHNAVNALAAIAIGRLFGVAEDRIAEGLRAAKMTGMRIERTAAWNGALVLNDAYNASPTSMRAAIGLVAQLTGFRRKWLVLGDMLELGPDEAAFHADIGRELSTDKADGLFAFGPLSALAAAEAKRRLPDGAVLHFADKRELADALLARLAPEDLVLVKASRGMRMEEVVQRLRQGTGGD
ncbi:UDP-N-acetylmuramoyl-tripeptide--D-alanyl-D-alanine ligase [Cohnella nanjingensis]|uniref:UDP-N-acetylmuramoyl-tripeptide--D-alanyl-D-alanine ligase n=1 Tax=Cohnella nanjingensis TaxID=1387779 RepID=A0A7X0VH89_9BACL|nr:UDP-N-acetylmuramoyl-tripeptide--D-alanyl-D-alanine ligase [Cohnella nanjingensis]MBB6673223.1 UDP-N-acetylmuramoyl-tripeptide--D-alanyl-D-alanine ligase [Cohnella nanjingensis]